jgi:hypothetical protein
VALRVWRLFLYSIVIYLATVGSGWAASETYRLDGRIVGAEGKSVSGAEVYLYRTKNVKKPADFISNKTGPDGLYEMILPPGKFFGVAILRKSGNKFGPLEAGDKHSGDPVELEIDGDAINLDFEVVDLREAARKVQKRNEQLFRISGTLLDESGHPLSMAYAVADKFKKSKNVPSYLSAWSDKSGEYALFMPKGKYFMGGEVVFPPDRSYVLEREINLEKDVSGVDIVVKGR